MEQNHKHTWITSSRTIQLDCMVCARLRSQSLCLSLQVYPIKLHERFGCCNVSLIQLLEPARSYSYLNNGKRRQGRIICTAQSRLSGKAVSYSCYFEFCFWQACDEGRRFDFSGLQSRHMMSQPRLLVQTQSMTAKRT